VANRLLCDRVAQINKHQLAYSMFA